jgi:hypothetical protein
MREGGRAGEREGGRDQTEMSEREKNKVKSAKSRLKTHPLDIITPPPPDKASEAAKASHNDDTHSTINRDQARAAAT